MSGLHLHFDPPGPVGAAFMQSMERVNAIMGPVGSGKTSCLMMKTIALAQMQPRSKLDGVRYTKALFVRNTFRQLYSTTIPSWWKWVPKKVGEWSGAAGQSATHHIRFRLPDTSIVDLRVEFEALGEQNVEDLFKGREFNLLNLNEGDTIAPEVLSQGLIRIGQGRYPGGDHVAPQDCIKMANIDYNAPSVKNYLYALREKRRPKGYKFFRQPGGLDPKAENRRFSTREDYERIRADLIAAGRDDLARRNVDNEYGWPRDGKVVFKEYRDSFHCAGEDLKPVQGITVKVDFDQGLRPAAILRQNMPNGQLRVLDELFCETGSKGLSAMLKKLIGSDKYRGVRVIGGLADLAGASPNGDEEESWIDKMNRLMGWQGNDRIKAAETNSIDTRLTAVREKLKTNVDDGQPGILISTSCEVLREGFASNYKYKKIKGTEEDYDPLPVKKFPIADVQDALQYGAMDEGGYEEAVSKARRARPAGGGGMRVAKVSIKV